MEITDDAMAFLESKYKESRLICSKLHLYCFHYRNQGVGLLNRDLISVEINN